MQETIKTTAAPITRFAQILVSISGTGVRGINI
jgi:hypothetical protein